MWLFYYFNFETNYDVLKSKGSCILLNKNIDFKKNKTKSKLENPTYSLREEKTFCFSSYKNRKLKVKLWWEGIFCTVYFVRKRSFTIFVLSQCILYWIHLQNIHTFTYQKTLFHTLFSLFLKLLEAFIVSWKSNSVKCCFLMSHCYQKYFVLSLFELLFLLDNLWS